MISPARMLFREFAYRWVSSLITILLVAFVCGTLTFFRVNRTGLEREISRNVRDIGSNVVILPIETDQVQYFANGGYTEQTMSSDVVKQLIEYRASLNHLIPMLERRTKVKFENKVVKARIVGISASIPMPGRPKSPMQRAIKKGEVQLGSQIAKSLSIERGQKPENKKPEAIIAGKTFLVQRVNRQTGTWQDGSVLMNLETAQDLFELPNQISRIEAIECASEKCAITGEDPQVFLRNELTRITDQASMLRREAMANARTGVRKLNTGNSGLLENTLWLCLAASMILLAGWNSFQRQSEIGVLHALGQGRIRIVSFFASRALILSCIGALAGLVLGASLGFYQSAELFVETSAKFKIDWLSVSFIAIVAILLCTLAACLPAIWIAGKNPADMIGAQK